MSAPSRRMRVRLFIENNGEYSQLEEWLSWAEAQIKRQLAEIDELRRQSSEIYRELATAKSELHETWVLAQKPSDLDDLQHRMDDIDRRLNKILALFNDKLGGGQTEQGMLHHSHAKEYVSLVEQQILSLTVEIFRRFPGTPPRGKSEFVAFVCTALFSSAEVQEEKFINKINKLNQDLPPSTFQRAKEICAEARALRAKVAQGRPHHWRFDYTRGAEIDPDWQDPWPGSVDDGVVDFVVAPAYIVDSDTLLKKQRVFTVSRADGTVPQKALQPDRYQLTGENPYAPPNEELDPEQN